MNSRISTTAPARPDWAPVLITCLAAFMVTLDVLVVRQRRAPAVGGVEKGTEAELILAV